MCIILRNFADSCSLVRLERVLCSSQIPQNQGLFSTANLASRFENDSTTGEYLTDSTQQPTELGNAEAGRRIFHWKNRRPNGDFWGVITGKVVANALCSAQRVTAE